MATEWSKCKRILDRENDEFKRTMEVEVSTSLSSKFSSKYMILAWVGIITLSQLNFAIFK